jgi:hypothetical protein
VQAAVLDRLHAERSGAVLTPCGRYRYLLWRRWDDGGDICAFIGLNPSTADETNDDPTVRRMRRFAMDWGYGELWVLNAYAWRATDPRALRQNLSQAVGPLNNEYVIGAAHYAARVVAAWGNHCDELRAHSIRQLVRGADKSLYHLGLTKIGQPRHPLYLAASTVPEPWA